LPIRILPLGLLPQLNELCFSFWRDRASEFEEHLESGGTRLVEELIATSASPRRATAAATRDLVTAAAPRNRARDHRMQRATAAPRDRRRAPTPRPPLSARASSIQVVNLTT